MNSAAVGVGVEVEEAVEEKEGEEGWDALLAECGFVAEVDEEGGEGGAEAKDRSRTRDRDSDTIVSWVCEGRTVEWRGDRSSVADEEWYEWRKSVRKSVKQRRSMPGTDDTPHFDTYLRKRCRHGADGGRVTGDAGMIAKVIAREEPERVQLRPCAQIAVWR